MAKIPDQYVATLAAAEAGVPMAMWKLGGSYLEGRHLDRDLAGAREWYYKAAKAGLAIGQRSYAWMLANGIGGPPNLDLAHQYYSAAAQAGDHEGAYQAGLNLLYGRGCKADVGQASQYLAIAETLANQQARAVLAYINADVGMLPLSPGETAYRLMASGRNGNMKATLALGLAYESGLLGFADFRSAEYYINCAADAGNADALFHKAGLLQNPNGGNDASAVIPALIEAANMGHILAQVDLATIYANGAWGVTLDRKAAWTWLQGLQGSAHPVAKFAIAQYLVAESSDAHRKEGLGLLGGLVQGVYSPAYSYYAEVCDTICRDLVSGDQLISALRTSADQGGIPAAYRLYEELMKAGNGTALFWLYSAADDCFPPAIEALANLHINETDSNSQVAGAYYLQMAERNGSQKATAALAELSYSGSKGVIRNVAAAVSRYEFLAENGSAEARANLNAMHARGECCRTIFGTRDAEIIPFPTRSR